MQEPEPSEGEEEDSGEGGPAEGDSDEGDDEDMIEPEDPFAPFDPNGASEDVQVATCASLVINWMGLSKASWVSGGDVWAFTQTICGRLDFPVFNRVKDLVKV